MLPALHGPVGLEHQRGFISALTAFVLLILLLVAALLVDTGRLFLEKRHLQKVADMAALEASARLPQGYCAGQPALAHQLALASAAAHGFTPDAQSHLSTRCVTLKSQNGLRQIRATPDAAVEVTASRKTPASLVLQSAAWASRQIDESVALTARATAQRSDAVAAFSVGSQLLRLEREAPVGRFLSAAGVDVRHLTVLEANGVASVQLSSARLLKALGVETSIVELALLTPSELAALTEARLGSLSLSALIEAMAALVDAPGLRTSLQALGRAVAANARLSEAGLTLFKHGDTGLIELNLNGVNTTRAVLESRVNLAELLAAALLTATGAHTVALESSGPLNLGVSARLVSPPAIAIGPVGSTAFAGQLRLDVTLDTVDLIPLTPFSSLLGTRIHFPLTIDLTNAQAQLTGLQCQAATPTADITVAARLLDACLGEAPLPDEGSGPQSCAARPMTEFLTLFGHPALPETPLHFGGLEHRETLPAMRAGERRTTQPNALTLSSTLSRLNANLLTLLANLVRPPPPEVDLLARLATQYLEATKQADGFYSVDDALARILGGSEERSANDRPIVPPLTPDYRVNNVLPALCLLGLCPVSSWLSADFSRAFRFYADYRVGTVGSLLTPVVGNSNYRACGGSINSRTRWNECMVHNLTELLKLRPQPTLIDAQDALSVANAATNTATCAGGVCQLLKPLLDTVKPSLNGLGELLGDPLADRLGIVLGRHEVHLHATECGVPTLVH